MHLQRNGFKTENKNKEINLVFLLHGGNQRKIVNFIPFNLLLFFAIMHGLVLP